MPANIAILSTRKSAFIVVCLLLAVVFGLSCNGNNNDNDGRIISPGTTTGQPIVDDYAAWSPDGSRIIYFRDSSKRKGQSWPWGVYLHDVAAGTDSLLWPSLRAFDLTWSPDGKSVAFSYGAQIYIQELATGVQTQVTHGRRNCCARWSPRDDFLAYTIRGGNPPRGLFLFSLLDSSHSHVLEVTNGADWFSDGLRLGVIHFDSSAIKAGIFSRADSSVVYLPDVGGTDLYNIAVAPNDSCALVVSSIGRSLEVFSIDLDSRAVTQLTTEGGWYPDWSPDGQWIVYTKVDLWNGHLWLMRPDGSDKHQITF